MKRFKLILLAASLALLPLLSGCAPSQNTSVPQDDGYRTVTDSYGREVKIPVKIETAAATGSAARMMTYAGCADKLAGVTDLDKTNEPGMPYTVVNAESFSSLASVGAGGSKDICYEEELIKLAPDVIFSTMSADTADDLQEKTNIPVIGLSYPGIFSEGVYSSLKLVGEIMGTQQRCEALVETMKGWQEDLNNRTKDIKEENKPTVYTGGVGFRGPHGFEGTYAKYPPFTAINAKNVVDETGADGALLIDLEKVLVWDPEIIFLNPGNMNLVNEDYKKNAPFYGSLSAVKKGQVYTQISYNYNSTNIEIAIADAYYAGKIIFPDRFTDIDPAEKADEIFEKMLGQTFYQQLDDAGIGFGKLTIGE